MVTSGDPSPIGESRCGAQLPTHVASFQISGGARVAVRESSSSSSACRGSINRSGSAVVVAGGGGQRDVYVRENRARPMGSDGYIKVSHASHASLQTQTQTTGSPAAARRFRDRQGCRDGAKLIP